MRTISLRPVLASDADHLYPLIYKSPVTDTLSWDGPESLDGFRLNLSEREAQTRDGERHIFTILEQPGKQPIGSASIRPDEEGFRADMGLWIGQPYHGKGYGTQVVSQVTAYGFDHLHLEKIDAYVFTENWASRRIFEKNGFSLEGTIRCAMRKRGRAVDEWMFGITRREYDFWQAHVLHICHRGDWETAQRLGVYRADTMETEGFIHASRPEQLLETANRFYHGVPDLVLLWIDLSKLLPEVRWEAAGNEEYPHIYGPINLDAVLAAKPYQPDEDGKFRSYPKL